MPFRGRLSPAGSFVLAVAVAVAVARPAPGSPPASSDKNLAEISVAGLEALYGAHRTTVSEVVAWHLDRLERYNGTYRAVQTVLRGRAMADARREDAEARRPGFHPGPLWGVPIVVKANTSVAGEVTTAGWRGFMLPRHALVAPRDATVVARLRAAGAVIIGITNMPDFAASDTTRSTAFGRTGNAYDVRFSPGGSSGGTVTAVTSDMAVLGTGTDTGNSIRMPAATSNLVGILPTRGLVSTAGIAPLDALLDDTGPIARSVPDAAVALDVMRGEDPLDRVTDGSAAHAPAASFSSFLRPGALRGRRFGVPAFILDGNAPVVQGLCPGVSSAAASKARAGSSVPLYPETRAAFLRAVDELRAAGATVVIDPTLMPARFPERASAICTLPYLSEGYERFLKDFGPEQYRSPDAYAAAVGHPIPDVILGGHGTALSGMPAEPQRRLEDDPAAARTYFEPKRAALDFYLAELARLHLDGFVYPAIQMPPDDETMPEGGTYAGVGGPHSATAWANMIGVPAISVPAGFYPDGLPFGIEFSGRPWADGDLIGWTFDYERHTHHRRPPVLIGEGTLPGALKPLDAAMGP